MKADVFSSFSLSVSVRGHNLMDHSSKKNKKSSGAAAPRTDEPTPAPQRQRFHAGVMHRNTKHERSVWEQNSKLIMPYLAKCSLPTWNSDPHILLKGLYLKANYFSPLASSFLWKLARQFWGPWRDQDETLLLCPLISSDVLRSFLSSAMSHLVVSAAICKASLPLVPSCLQLNTWN